MTLTPSQLARIAEYVMPDLAEERADIGLLFGTRHGVEEFCLAAHSLWERGMFGKLVVSGGCTPGGRESEADVIGGRLLQLGRPREAMILEREATNTGENVTLAMRLLARMKELESIDSVLVIGKQCSMRRYLMTLERHWPGPRKFACPVNYFGVDKSRWYEHEEFRARVLSEFGKITEYLQRDFLRELAWLAPYPDAVRV